jgi:SAM-dependent methyltransferase
MIRHIFGRAAQTVWKASCIGCPLGEPLVRYSMYRNLRSEFGDRDLGDRVLSISHSKKLCGLLGAQETAIVEANYPEQSINDLNFRSQSFSAVVSDQVLEHVECTPDEAVNEVHRVLKPGGLAIHTTCFLTPYHGSSDFTDLHNGDFWRFTPSGLRRLHKRYSEVIAANGWGNPLMPLLGGLGLLNMSVPEISWHPLNKLARLDRTSYGYTVWVMAKK